VGPPGDVVAHILEPPIETIGVLPLDAFMSTRARSEFAASGRGGAHPRTSTTKSALWCSASCSKRSSPRYAACPTPSACTRWSSSTKSTASSHPTPPPHGLWCIGRVQTDADRERVVEALGGTKGELHYMLDSTLRVLAPRWFVMRNAHDDTGAKVMQPRWAMTNLRGPMTRSEIKRVWG